MWVRRYKLARPCGHRWLGDTVELNQEDWEEVLARFWQHSDSTGCLLVITLHKGGSDGAGT